MAARLTVLGGCGARPEAGRACSGFLVEKDGFRLVLDLGFATLPRLLGLCPEGEVDAVVVTHAHPDHCVDLQGLLRVRLFREERGPRIPLYCPPDVVERILGLEPTEDPLSVFEMHALPGRHRVGPFELDGRLLPHYVPNAGVRLEAPGLVLAYTGDTGPTPLLADLGRGADLYVMEATFRDGPARPSLSSAAEAGVWAAEAGARRLMLTHFRPGAHRPDWVAEARRAFAEEVLTADEGLTVDL